MDYQSYKDQLIDQAALMLTLSGRVKETMQVLATQFNFRLRTPDLLIKVRWTPHQGRKYIKYNILGQTLCSLCFFDTADREGHGGREDVGRDFIY